MVHARAIFNFSNDIDVTSAVFIQERPQILHIPAVGNKGSRHEVHSIPDAKQQVFLILLAEEVVSQHPVGEIHTLPVRQIAPCQDPAPGIAALQLLHPENDQAVVDHDGVAHLQVLYEALIGDGNPGLISHHIVGGKGKHIPIVKGDPLICKGFDPVLRSLGVQHNGNGELQLLPDLPDQIDFLLMLLVRAMRKIQARHIHARQTHLSQGLLIFTGRPNGADDFRFPHTATSQILYSISSYHESRIFQGKAHHP